MIAAARNDGLTVLSFELPAGTVAHVDADWVVAGVGAAVPALIGDAGGVRFDDGPPLAPPGGASGDAAAAAVLAALAREAAAAAGEAPGPVHVSGSGLVAHEVRRLVGAGAPGQGGRTERPAAWVDTTGDPAVIAAAAQRVADMGILVLAGEPVGRRLAIDLYDVHRRGLRVVGVGRPAQAAASGPPAGAEFPAPASAVSGEPLAPAPWYRLGTSGGDR